jgi:hypothetical protein
MSKKIIRYKYLIYIYLIKIQSDKVSLRFLAPKHANFNVNKSPTFTGLITLRGHLLSI